MRFCKRMCKRIFKMPRCGERDKKKYKRIYIQIYKLKI